MRAVLITDCHVRPASGHHCLAVTLNANQLRSWSSHAFKRRSDHAALDNCVKETVRSLTSTVVCVCTTPNMEAGPYSLHGRFRIPVEDQSSSASPLCFLLPGRILLKRIGCFAARHHRRTLRVQLYTNRNYFRSVPPPGHVLRHY